MSRLQTERQRLFQPPASEGLIDAQGRVRALVLEIRAPADWALLGRLWQGVQQDLGWPAPAIAVSGGSGLQLWFSLAEPVAAAAAQAGLRALAARYLPGLPARRLDLWPDADGRAHAPVVPAEQADGNWSAFVAPDLAPVFADTPWLDIPPGDENQAAVLRGLASLPAAAWAAWSDHQAVSDAAAAAPGDDDPRRFLLRVMQDESAPLALRIEAAKALLPRS